MKFQLPDGQELNFRPLSDAEYSRAEGLARSLDICPTCGGRDSVVVPGYKEWVSDGYRYQGEHHDCDCRLQLALYARYLLANIGEQYMRLDWNEFAGSPTADFQVRQYVEKWSNYRTHGFGLTFASIWQGVGKTWAATHIGKELIKHRVKVYFIDFTQMVDAFCDDKHEIEERMKGTTLLILDDVRVGISERQQELYALKFETVIRHRTNYNLPTIFTTNLTEDRFEYGFPRIYSLIRPKQMWMEMEGADYRKLSETAVETAEMIANNEVRPIT